MQASCSCRRVNAAAPLVLLRHSCCCAQRQQVWSRLVSRCRRHLSLPLKLRSSGLVSQRPDVGALEAIDQSRPDSFSRVDPAGSKVRREGAAEVPQQMFPIWSSEEHCPPSNREGGTQLKYPRPFLTVTAQKEPIISVAADVPAR